MALLFGSGDRLRERMFNTPTQGTSAMLGQPQFQQLLAAYNNRQPVRSMTSTGEGQSDYYTPNSASLNGYQIEAFGPNQDMYRVYQNLPDGADQLDFDGRSFDVYNNGGQYVGSHQFQNMGGGPVLNALDKAWDKAIPLLTMAFIGGGAAGAFGGGAAGAGEGAAAGLGEGAGSALTTGGGGFGSAGQVFGGNLGGTGYGFSGVGSSLGGGSGLGGAFGSGLGAYGSYAYPGLGSSLLNAGAAAGSSGLPAGGLPPAGGGGGGSTPAPTNGGGVVPPNPYANTGPLGALQNILGGNGTAANWMGLGSTLLGALSGGQGQSADQSSTRQLPAFLQGPVANSLVPQTQATMTAQMPGAAAAGQQLTTMGSGLLGRTEPTTATNPYATGILDDLQRRSQEMIDRGILAADGNATGMGARGGSRQGVLEAEAITRGADNFTGQAANLMGNLYNQDQSRLRQDWTIGSGLMNQGINTPFQPLQNTAQIYSPFTGFGTTSQNTSSGGGWQGAVGGAIAGAALGRQAGWW